MAGRTTRPPALPGPHRDVRRRAGRATSQARSSGVGFWPERTLFLSDFARLASARNLSLIPGQVTFRPSPSSGRGPEAIFLAELAISLVIFDQPQKFRQEASDTAGTGLRLSTGACSKPPTRQVVLSNYKTPWGPV